MNHPRRPKMNDQVAELAQRSLALSADDRECLADLLLCSLAAKPAEMTTSEQKMLWRGVAAGTLVGLAFGLIIALAIAIRPELFRALIP